MASILRSALRTISISAGRNIPRVRRFSTLNQAKPAKNVLLLVGRLHDKDSRRELPGLEAAFAKGPASSGTLLRVGDGVSDVTLSDFQKSLAAMQPQKHPTLIFAFAHGVLRDGVHHTDLAAEAPIPTASLFRATSEVLDQTPINWALTQCYGGAAAPSAHALLPRGSLYFAASHADFTAQTSAISSFRGALPKQWINGASAEDLFSVWTRQQVDFVPPVLGCAGQWCLDFKTLLGNLQRRVFSEAERHGLKARLRPLHTEWAVDHMLNQLARGDQLYPHEYGVALAVVNALSRKTPT